MIERDVRSAPGSDLIPQRERELFVAQFEKDLQFYQLFFLLINRSCPIRNVDLVWVEHGPEGRVCRRHLGINEALAGSGPRLLGCGTQNPHPSFCNIINDYGRRELKSCSISDAAAEDLIRWTGKTQVYRCHFGLIDIAVPVMVRGQHIATLFTGQVLRAPPSHEEFVQITEDTSLLNYIDLKQLEQAYWQVPTVSGDDIRNAIEMLEGFATYLANSWLRLAEAIREQRRKDRELRLARKEFAYHVLEGGRSTWAAAEEMREIVRKVGFTRPPNRVIVVSFATPGEKEFSAASFDLSLATAQQAVEEVCEKLDNVVPVHLLKTGTCVFFNDSPTESDRSGASYSHRLASRILHAVGDVCELSARIGIGAAKDEWSDLALSYREACSALVGSPNLIVAYQEPTGSLRELSGHSEQICRLVTERDLAEAKSVIQSLPSLVGKRLGSGAEGFMAARLFFYSALESLCSTARELGCDSDVIKAVSDAANEDFQRATDVLESQKVWLCSAVRVVEAIDLLYSAKRTKIVERARLMIDHHLKHGGAHQLSISTIAAELSVSSSHMSRIFKRGTGQTFESYLMTKRIELAKRLLLDPLRNVSQVAQTCGFSDASYFSRVFRKVAGCSPTDYCQDPLHSTRAAG